jgi:2-keto-4-pentenoate hydratase/2-oxohepta-3-ene-1,7-dioic acid hydratase in catechol pathway
MQFTLGTFSHDGGAPFPALVLADRVVPLGRLGLLMRRMNVHLVGRESVLAVLANWDRNFAVLNQLVAVVLSGESGVDSIELSDLHAHAPLEPRQIFCTIANYRSAILDSVRDPAFTPRLGEPESTECLRHAAQFINDRLRTPPYVCFKLPSTVIGPTDDLELPRHVKRPDWELELGVVIGRVGRHVPKNEAMSYVAGYTLVNDITVRELVARPDLPRLASDWLQSKNAPGFLPMGPYFVPAAFVADPYALRLTLRLNGEVMQDEAVSDMLFDIATQIEYISQHARLLPGDVICTGTPAGAGTRYKRFLKRGDIMESTAPGLGTQRTTCVTERVG